MRMGREMAAGYTPCRAQKILQKKGVHGLRFQAAVGGLRVVAAWERFPSKERRYHQSR